MIDSRDIKELHPALQRAAIELIARAKKACIEIFITSTYRDGEYQNKLYAQGRSTPGLIVTNAKSGESIHNYRLAFDFALLKNGVADWNDIASYNAVGRVGMDMGLEWGGSWVGFVDKPHFEYTGGLTLKQLQNKQSVPADAKLKWEIEKAPAVAPLLPITAASEIAVNINGKLYKVPGYIIEGVSYAQLRPLAEGIGCTVGWDAVTKTVLITN